MDIKFSINGLKELEAALHDLNEEFGPKSAGSAIRPAIKKAMAPIESAISAGTPVDSGGLQSTVTTKIGKVTKKMNYGGHFSDDTILAGRSGYFWSDKPSYYSQTLSIEFGTTQISAFAPLRNALDMNAEGVLNEFRSELVIAIEKTATRLAKKRMKG